MKKREAPRKLHADETVRADEAGNYRVIMEREAFDRRVSRYQELSSRMRQIAAAKNTSLMDVTITKKLVAQENAVNMRR